MSTGLARRAAAVLQAAEPADKIALTRDAAAAWRAGGLDVGAAEPPGQPARPTRPELKAPRDMPKRNAGGGRTARARHYRGTRHE